MKDELKKILLDNVSKIHTTNMGVDRIKKNLQIEDDPVLYSINIVKNNKSIVTKEGKNYYVSHEDIVITINSYSYTIITAHRLKESK